MKLKRYKSTLMVPCIGVLALAAQLSAVGSGELDGEVSLTTFAAFTACFNGPDTPPQGGCAVDADYNDDGDSDLSDLAALQNAFTGQRWREPIPAKHITLDVIGIHDAASENYDADCISCHGDRTYAYALDGTTLVTHGYMVEFFGVGNERCLYCHESGTDFLSGSAGGMRKQIGIWATECALCHLTGLGGGGTGAPEFYMQAGP